MVTAKEVTNWYLYEQETTPTNLVDDSLIRPASVDPIIKIEIDAKDFMETAGRFAIGSQFELVQRFFYEDNEPLFELAEDGTVIPVITDWEEFTQVGTYSKDQLAAPDKFNLPFFGWNMQHYNWRDETDDYAERVYIYNSQLFKISDGAKFVVEDDGTKWIKDFAIEPLIPDEPDDFDFESSDWAAFLGNELVLEPNIDPSEIGRSVDFDYIDQDKIVPDPSYTRLDYDNDVDKWNSFTKGLNAGELLEGINQLTDDLFDQGVTKFLDDENKPIIYGTEAADQLPGGVFNAPKLQPSIASHSVAVLSLSMAL